MQLLLHRVIKHLFFVLAGMPGMTTGGTRGKSFWFSARVGLRARKKNDQLTKKATQARPQDPLAISFLGGCGEAEPGEKEKVLQRSVRRVGPKRTKKKESRRTKKMKRALGQSTTSAGGSPPSEMGAEAVPLSKREWLLERFPLLSYLVHPILCIPPCYWPFSWPRLRRKKVEGHRFHRRDYLDYEECTLEKRRNKAAARQFIIDNDLSGFADVFYLPGDPNSGFLRRCCSSLFHYYLAVLVVSQCRLQQ